MLNSASPVCAVLCAAVNSEAIVCHDGFDAYVWRRHAPRHRAAARLEFARRRLCGSERFFGGRDAHDSRGSGILRCFDVDDYIRSGDDLIDFSDDHIVDRRN
jgi:hypothetical protein